MDPAYQVRAFLGGSTGPSYPSPRGLFDIPNWQSLSKGTAVQAVEVSAYPERYATWEPVANAILINHAVGGAYTSLYGHMWDDHLYVQAGDHVVAGQHIADVGSNGNSTGPHLHFDIRPNNDYRQVIDSNRWLADHGAVGLDGATTSPQGCYVQGGNA
ncbi:MAG: M23 family metallopeptidase [Propionibacteriaceae bacterium]|jgi:hypothetical protein|nr:M23 family metallopeptidase [Propionibacteriaceae bacterium]